MSFTAPSFCPSQDKRGSILIVGLWILVILTLLAVGAGWRASSELRFVRNQRDRLKASYLAKAGVFKAIIEIENDQSPDCDTLKDNWADNEDVFKEIKLEGNGFATVSYAVKDKGAQEEKVIYGLIDEERKINLNQAAQALLSSLPQISRELADNISAFRSKNKQFVNIEELLLVEGITPEIYGEAKDLITAWGEAVNINTASGDVLEILINASVKELSMRNEPERDPADLLERIVLYREGGGIFEDTDLENYLEGLSSAQKNVINELKKYLTVNSNFFRVVSDGRISVSKLKSRITCVWDSGKKRYVYWNEN